MLGEPEGASSTGLETWLLTKLDLPLFESFYSRAGGEIIYADASFGEYDGDVWTDYDFAMIRDGELNGIRRFYNTNGVIFTRTYKDGDAHGLSIT